MVTCSVPGCKSTKRKNPNKYTFHVFPVDELIREKWVRLVQREGWVPRKYSVVCSKHFEKDCFSDGAELRVKLRAGSVPTLFMPVKLKSKRSSLVRDSITPIPAENVTKSSEDLPQTSTTMTTHQNGYEGTMSEDTVTIHEVKEEMISECRTCLQPLSSDEDLYYIFQSWVPPWEGVEDTIAEALQRITHIQLSDMDPLSKVICGACCQKLHTACLFANLAQQSDYVLRQRNPSPSYTSIDNMWPKPILIDKNVPLEDQNEIKQEQSFDEEDSGYSRVQTNCSNDGQMEIKTEPIELIPQRESPVQLNGHHEGIPEGVNSEEINCQLRHMISVNGDDFPQEHYSIMVKQEPASDNESVVSDISLDCLLCTKVFSCVSGLKAHVIAYHSYKSVRRKASNDMSPLKTPKHEHVCVTCRRGFTTSTDLMVHETCHNKSVCYGCNEKFDSFEFVMQHRLTCKAVNNKKQVPVKTLEDAQRPQPSGSGISEDVSKEPLQCTLCGESFTDDYYMNIHMEIHHSEPVAAATDEEMEVEALESLFTERA